MSWEINPCGNCIIHPNRSLLPSKNLDFPTIFLLFSHYFPIRFPLFCHSFPIIFPLFSHYFLILFPLFSHSFPTIFPFFSHSCPAIFPILFPFFSHFPTIFPLFTYNFWGHRCPFSAALASSSGSTERREALKDAFIGASPMSRDWILGGDQWGFSLTGFITQQTKFVIWSLHKKSWYNGGTW